MAIWGCLRRHLLIGFAVGIAICGCSRQEPQAPVRADEPGGAERREAPQQRAAELAPRTDRSQGGVGESVLGAPGDYLHTVTVKAPRHARKTINLAQIRHEIEQFRAEKARYPRSLDELEQWRGVGLPELPRGLSYSYDAESGELAVVQGK